MRIQAYSLSEAYQIASQKLQASASDINIEIVSKGSSGFFGFFKKLGEYEASINKATQKAKVKERKEVKDFRKPKKEEIKNEVVPKQKSQKLDLEPKPQIKEEIKPEPKAELKASRTDAFKAFDSMIDTFNAESKDELKDTNTNLENSKNHVNLENSDPTDSQVKNSKQNSKNSTENLPNITPEILNKIK